MPIYVDAHCHLDHPDIMKDIGGVIRRAADAGVKAVITAGLDPETNRAALGLSAKYGLVKAAIGIYPIDALAGETGAKNIFDVDDEIRFIEKNRDKIIAVGECGLDMNDNYDLTMQKDVFRKMILLAEKIKKPLIVHSRKAEKEVLEMIESSGLKKVMLHCFSGRKNLVKKGADMGCYFSVPANITRSGQFQLLAGIVNINQLLTETDSPFLSPYPGERSEPAFVAEAVKKIAEIKGFEEEEVANNIFMNYQRLFF